MKTREQFVLLAEAYQTEVRRRAFLLLPVMVLLIIVWVLLAAVMGRYLGNHSALIGIWIVFFFSMLLGLNFYQTKSQQSLATKFELVCPSCARVIPVRFLNVAIANHNCPNCGAAIFS